MSAEQRSIADARPALGPATPADLEAIAAKTASSAAALVRSRLGRSHVAATKTTPTDVVTVADIEVEAFIQEQLRKATPGSSFYGEEHGATDGTTRIGWIVDPIDGTVNFLYGLPVVSVSIAATIDGEVVAGAVVDVVRDEVFRAAKSGGARLDGDPVAPTSVDHLADSLVGTGFSYDSEMRRREGEIAARVLPAVRDIRGFGSSALHLCWVACGRLDAYYQHGVKSWDMAAGALIASEAGARVEVVEGSRGSFILASATGIFDDLHAIVTGG